MMRFGVLVFLGIVPALFGADEQELALAIRAQSDFERVELPQAPQLQDTARCTQSQAALLSIAPRAEMALTHFRKGYCTLAGAAITGNAADFGEAASEFEKAIEAWPDRTTRNAKDSVLEPVSSGLRILATVARLKARTGAAGWDRARQEISAAIQPPACPSNIMPVNLCELLLQTGRQWLGWMALERDELYQAAKELSGMPETAWSHWIAGRQAFADRKYKDAAAQYGEAVNLWTRGRTEQSLVARLAPQPEMAVTLGDLGAAQLLNGDPAAAIGNLDASIKADSERAQTVYLRARAKELTGQTEQALADYSLASRTAFAHAQDLASGEAHLYRGILMYRRKDYPHAEDEFSSALNFDISATLRPDASAWRHMPAVAAGACGASRGHLEESLERVSPYFPKDEARKVAASCPLSGGPAASSSALR